MDGRRHSIDVPISRTLVALRRVRSLRDPSTNSMTKLVDNLNWETNSNSAILLGSENSYSKDTIPGLRSSTLLRDEEQLVIDSELCYGSNDCQSRAMSPKAVGSKAIAKQEQKRNYGGSKRRSNRLCRVTADDVLSFTDSPCLSISDPYGNEDGVVESCRQGCGITNCWSRTLKLKESNPVEERPLLLGTGSDIISVCEDNTNWTHSLESPRSLCEKYMPKSFNELVGQNIIASSLLAAISRERISSFSLFHGPPGIGKTSASRIFAAALNCLSHEIDRPCGFCQECVLFFSGRSRDIKEVDLAKINNIDKCKSILKTAETSPVLSRFKVFIIDECQLLRGETWMMILNRLDRLPPHVIFIMVCEDLEKLPRSAVAKFQKYHFQKIKDFDIANKLMKICVEEGLAFDQNGLNLIAAKSNGSLRNAEMMLDQLSLLEKKITLSLINEVNGIVSDDEMLDLLHLALSSDASNTIKRARELMRSRIDPLQLTSQLANLIMDILAGKCPSGASEINRKLFGLDNTEADIQQLSHALNILSQTEKQLRATKNQATWLIVALLQLSSAGSTHDGSDPRLSVQTLPPQDIDFQSTSSTGESLKHHFVCQCNNSDNRKMTIWNSKENLEVVWKKATGMCISSCLQKFLHKRGKLVSICLTQGIAVAELEFDSPDSVSKAEKSWKVIATALQQTVGRNVELRMNSASSNDLNKYGKHRKSSFSLFNCSRRVHLTSQFSVESASNGSESGTTPTTVITRNKHAETTCSSEFECCHRRELFKTIRNIDGNAFSVAVDASNISQVPETMVRENIPLNEEVNSVYANSIALKPEREHRGKRFLKLPCWRSALLPFQKAWRLTHQPTTEHLVDFALHGGL